VVEIPPGIPPGIRAAAESYAAAMFEQPCEWCGKQSAYLVTFQRLTDVPKRRRKFLCAACTGLVFGEPPKPPARP
jgi:predicted SprT family Zn-dependent metalloprotease